MARTNKRFYWLKLPKDFFEDRSIKRLRKISGGDTYTIIYLKILLKTLESNGFYYYEGVEDNIISEIALDIDESLDDVEITVNYLVNKNLMVVSDSKAELLQMSKLVGSETASTQRSRKHRELQSATKALQCNTNATDVQHNCNGEKEKEKEIEIELEKKIELESEKKIELESEKELKKDSNTKSSKEKKKKAEKKESFDSLIDSYTDNQELKQALNDYIEMRKSIKHPLTIQGLKQAFNKLDKIAVDDLTKIDIVNQSVFYSWQGLFPVKSENNNNNQGRKERGYAF